MEDVLGYAGKNAVITGAASGMGQAAAQLLVDLGATVYALDIAEITVPEVRAHCVDLKDASTIDAALAELPERIHAVFNCAGVPSPPCSMADTVLINFSGLRYLTECLIPSPTFLKVRLQTMWVRPSLCNRQTTSDKPSAGCTSCRVLLPAPA